jgi:hypothetical protein
MNNAKTKYILIVLVVMIWGLVLYRVGKGMFGTDEPVPVVQPAPSPVADTVAGYTLMASVYPDPFANDTAMAIEEEEKDDSVAKVPLMATQPVIMEPPPAIIYNGYIFNPVTKKRTAMISINGRGMTAGINEKIDVKTQVLDITQDKLIVSYNGRRMEIVLSGS